MPGVTAVGQINALPTMDWHLRSNFDVDWKPRTQHGDAANVEDRNVAGNYFRAMGVPLLAGRTFTEADLKAKPPKALVNQQFARQYFAEGNVIGHHLINSTTQFEIIGIVGDVRGTAGSIAKPVGPEVYYLADGYEAGRFLLCAPPCPQISLPEQFASKYTGSIARRRYAWSRH
ncbi:MAG TPA: ABC transporter permease [Bryobacteraceae bacterium]|nr:ABC transporter permease [Bryobacteraceae bacterium]